MKNRASTNPTSFTLPGKEATVVVTGANGGIGRALCEAFATQGCRVIMACRNRERGEAAAAEVKRTVKEARLTVERLDVASPQSIKAFVGRLHNRGEKVTHLVNNAGCMAPHLAFTPEGIEANMATNCRGTLCLADSLMEEMDEGSVVVNTVSLMCHFGHFPPRAGADGTFSYHGHYRRLQAYADSKLMLFVETARRVDSYRRRGIALHAADPGVVSTGIIRMGCWFDPLTDVLFRPIIRTTQQGALAALHAASCPEQSGLLFTAHSCRPFPRRILRLAQQLPEQAPRGTATS